MTTYEKLRGECLCIKSDKVREIALAGLDRMHQRITDTTNETHSGMDQVAAVYAVMWLHSAMTDDREGQEIVTILFMAQRRKFAPVYVLRHYIDMLESGYSPTEVQAVPPMEELPTNLPTAVLEQLIKWKEGLKYVSDKGIYSRIMAAFAKYIYELEIYWGEHLAGKVAAATVKANAGVIFAAKTASDLLAANIKKQMQP